MAKQNKFGTFGGVFVPSILTILGVIMYLRLPTIVGEAGLWATIGIIIIAHLISVTTGLSVSSIATDKKVEAGGTYYMISRSLGLPIGGTLGIALFVGLSFSVSLYLIGFSEILLDTAGIEITKNNIRIYGSLALAVITIVTFISTSLAIKSQYFILGLILLSLVSIFWGIGDHKWVATTPALLPNPGSKFTLMALFGIFFPAVTGFEAGVSMSGDLQDPKKSIPGGSIMAIAVGFIVYVGLAIFLSFTIDAGFLRSQNEGIHMVGIAKYGELVIAGIMGATLSSALGSILGAPRILQATAVDKITPTFFSKGSGKTNEPRNALLLTFVIAEAGILLGELNLIARIVSIFFITTYGFLNISAAFEKWTSADFRPEFKVSGWISVIGALACILVMIQLDFLAMMGASLLMLVLFFYLKNKELRLESGDAWSGVWASLVKRGLTRLTKNKLHNRNWRPNVIMFSGNPNTRKYMIQMGKAISGRLGILSAFELIESETRILAKTAANLKEEDTDDSGYFHYRFNCRDAYSGMDSISRLYGFSGIEPNTILMGWSRNPRSKDQFIDLLKGFDQNGYNSVFLDYDDQKKFGNQRTVDIWWSGKDRNLSLAAKIIQHLTTSEIWNVTKTRLMIINPINAEAENVYRAANAIMKQFRIDADVRVINNEIDPLSQKEIIHDESESTDLVILGISDLAYRKLGDHYDDISAILDGVGSSLVINASETFESYEVIKEITAESQGISTEFHDFNLPEIKLSKYPEIATDMAKLKQNGSKVLELFFRKTFAQTSRDRVDAIKEIQHRIESVQKEIKKVAEVKEQLRRKKAIDKLKNDTFYKVNTLLKDNLSKETLSSHKEKLSQGLNWYLDRLKSELAKFPIKLAIQYQEEDLAVLPGDRAALKFNKRFIKFKKVFSGGVLSKKVAYRESARYYQYQNRLDFLRSYLAKLLDEEVAFYEKLRNITKKLFAFLDNLERKSEQESEDWHDQTILQQLTEEIDQFSEGEKALDIVQKGRLQLEYLKNLQEMNDDLSQVDVDFIIAGKLKKESQVTSTIDHIREFPESYDLKIRNTLNLILIELSVNATRSRMEAIRDGFLLDLDQQMERKYFRELENILSSLSNDEESLDSEKVNLSIDLSSHLKESYDQVQNRILPLIEQMPESLEIFSASGDKEQNTSVSIPVARMMEYYFKSLYQLPVDESFERFYESLKRSIHSIRDFINLADMTVEDDAKGLSSLQENDFLAETMKKISQESEMMKEEALLFKKQYNTRFEAIFTPLAPVKIEESAEDFSTGLRTYQSKQVINSLGQLYQGLQIAAQRVISKLFYSRSEGILFAKKIKTPPPIQSRTSQLLSLREAVNPKKSITTILPHYYVTLFNGKSSIGKDFWVSRPEEEGIFKNALKRYREGYKGGIMVLGDRNSGKTAFVRYMAQECLKNQHIYTIFPSVQGTTSVKDFEKAVAKATQKKGSIQQIISRLPAGSTLIINDLELFWKKKEGGNKVIQLIQQLIDQYSDKVLFILNANPYAYRLIHKENELEPYFIEIINMCPFDAEEIKQLVMKRHRSSGLGTSYEADKSLSEVQYAHLFNKYFDYSLGNPGTALTGWLSNIQKLSKGNLVITKPERPDLGIFATLEDSWKELLVQMIFHKRLTTNGIMEVTGWEESKVQKMILSMSRAGLLIEKVPGTYLIDPFIQPFLTDSLNEQGLL